MRLRSLFAIALAVFLLPSCGSDTGPGEMPAPMGFELERSSAPAGATVALQGIDAADLDLARVTATVGGEPVVILSNDAGEMRLALPFLFDETERKWVGSGQALEVELRDGLGESIARSSQGIEIIAPAAAPGACAQVVEAYDRIAAALQSLGGGLALTPGDEGLAWELAGPLVDATLHGDEQSSLAALFAQMSAEDLALLDAAFGATGYAEDVEALADLFTELAAVLEPIEENGALKRTTELADFQLAALMQMSVYATRYGNWYLNGVASDLSNVNTAVSVAGLMQLLRRAPVVGQFFALSNLLVSALDFVVNKHLIALLPVEIDAFELQVADTELEPNQLTASTMQIRASNRPPGVTLNDYIGQLLNALSLAMPADATELESFLLELSGFLVEQINNLVADYAARFPEILVPAEIYRVPEIQWEARITSPQLVELRSTVSSVAAREPGDIEWRAADGNGGSTSVQVLPSRESEAILLPSLLGIIEYNAGAFGEDITPTNSVELHVAVPLRLETDFAGTITPGGANALEVKAGYADDQGGLDYQSGVQIQLAVTGGTVDDSSGATDADGSFITLARLSGNSQQITIEITATDSVGTTASATVTATTGSPLGMVERHSFVSARTRLDFVPDGANFDCDEADDTSFDQPGTWTSTNSATCDLPFEGEQVYRYAQATQTSDLQLQSLEPSLPVLLRATGTGTTDNQYSSNTSAVTGSNTSNARTFYRLDFRVESGPLQIDYDCLSGVSSPITGSYGRVYLVGPGGTFVFNSQTHPIVGGGALANGSTLLESGDYTFAIDLVTTGTFSEFTPQFEFEVEIRYPE